jgi:hypothetical protein
MARYTEEAEARVTEKVELRRINCVAQKKTAVLNDPTSTEDPLFHARSTLRRA